jgi:hypothetical protein
LRQLALLASPFFCFSTPVTIMRRHTHSENVKKQCAWQALNKRYQQPVQHWEDEQAKAAGTKENSACMPLRPCLRGWITYPSPDMSKEDQRNRWAFIASKQKLLLAEERVLADAALKATNLGFPMSRNDLVLKANAILQARTGDASAAVGKHWVQGFLDRHYKELQTSWSCLLNTKRACALNPTIIRHWFKELDKKRVVNTGIRPEDMYGMNKSGFQPADTERKHIITCRGRKTTYKQGSAVHENVSVLVTISGNGSVMTPVAIFKGQRMNSKWRRNNIASCTCVLLLSSVIVLLMLRSMSVSPKGWINQDIAVDWLTEVFNPETKEKADGCPRMLFVDGHNSHTSSTFLCEAVARNILVLAYPPHCTNALQGLDVVGFAKMKNLWREEITAFKKRTKCKVSKVNFAGVFGKAFLVAFKPDTVRAAWEATGIIPYNPGVITPS